MSSHKKDMYRWKLVLRIAKDSNNFVNSTQIILKSN